MPDDNLIEEIAEEVVEAKTGIDIDLTPYTYEYETRTLSPSQPPMRLEGAKIPKKKGK